MSTRIHSVMYHVFICCFSLILLLNTAACDGVLRSVCVRNPDQPQCYESADAGSINNNSQLAIPEKVFVQKAKFESATAWKFAGIRNRKALFVFDGMGGNPVWKTRVLDLNNEAVDQRILPGECYDCGNITNMDFVDHNFYVTKSSVYLFSYNGNRKLEQLAPSPRREIKDVLGLTLLTGTAVHSFVSPDIDMMVASVDSGISGLNRAYVFWDQQSWHNIIDTDSPTTCFVVGDIDPMDPDNKGIEYILFAGKDVKSVYHQNQSGKSDDALAGALQKAIQRTAAGDISSIQAAAVAKLNNDPYADIIYVRNGRFYIMSYIADFPMPSQNYFKEWPALDISLGNETVRYLTATDLTNDGLADLVIETDKALYFYVNEIKQP